MQPNGFLLKTFPKEKYFLSYSKGIFAKFPKLAKAFLLDNFIYARTRSLSILTDYILNYQTAKPYLQNFIDQGLLNDLPRSYEIAKIDPKKPLRRFKQSQKDQSVIFSGQKVVNYLPYFFGSSKKAVLALSFGKDSLLSYGLAKEIGLDVKLAVDLDWENYSSLAWQKRVQVMKLFKRQEKEKLITLRDNIDTVLFNKQIKKSIQDLENINAILAFILELMPIVYASRAKYLIFGNEKNLDNFYINSKGHKAYPSFDQSSIYINKVNQLMDSLTDGKFKVISLVKPLYNLAEIKILYSRYPYLLQYVISCYPKVKHYDRWCCHCPLCARVFLYAAAVGGDPEKIGIIKNMFLIKYKELFPLLAPKLKVSPSINRPYVKPPQVKEEQLLAFFLAYRNGWRGPLIDLFKRNYFNEAEKRQKELRRKYFGIYEAPNLPKEIKQKLYRIYHQELDHLI